MSFISVNQKTGGSREQKQAKAVAYSNQLRKEANKLEQAYKDNPQPGGIPKYIQRRINNYRNEAYTVERTKWFSGTALQLKQSQRRGTDKPTGKYIPTNTVGPKQINEVIVYDPQANKENKVFKGGGRGTLRLDPQLGENKKAIEQGRQRTLYERKEVIPATKIDSISYQPELEQVATRKQREQISKTINDYNKVTNTPLNPVLARNIRAELSNNPVITQTTPYEIREIDPVLYSFSKNQNNKNKSPGTISAQPVVSPKPWSRKDQEKILFRETVEKEKNPVSNLRNYMGFTAQTGLRLESEASLIGAPLIFLGTAGKTAFDTSPIGITNSLISQGVVNTLESYNPLNIIKAVKNDDLLKSTSPVGKFAELGGLALGVYAGSKVTDLSWNKIKTRIKEKNFKSYMESTIEKVKYTGDDYLIIDKGRKLDNVNTGVYDATLKQKTLTIIDPKTGKTLGTQKVLTTNSQAIIKSEPLIPVDKVKTIQKTLPDKFTRDINIGFYDDLLTKTPGGKVIFNPGFKKGTISGISIDKTGRITPLTKKIGENVFSTQNPKPVNQYPIVKVRKELQSNLFLETESGKILTQFNKGSNKFSNLDIKNFKFSGSPLTNARASWYEKVGALVEQGPVFSSFSGLEGISLLRKAKPSPTRGLNTPPPTNTGPGFFSSGVLEPGILVPPRFDFGDKDKNIFEPDIFQGGRTGDDRREDIIIPPIIQPLIDTKPFSNFNQEFDLRLRDPVKTGDNNIIDTIQSPSTKQDDTQAQRLFISPPIQLEESITRQINIPIPKPPRPREKSKVKPKLKFNDKEKGFNNLIQGYNVLVKEKGRFIKVNKQPLPENKAKNLGADVVDNTPTAQFKLKRAKKIKADDTNKFFKSSKFRAKNGSYIERNAFRIDSPGELNGITVKGWLKNKKNFGGI